MDDFHRLQTIQPSQMRPTIFFNTLIAEKLTTKQSILKAYSEFSVIDITANFIKAPNNLATQIASKHSRGSYDIISHEKIKSPQSRRL